VVSALEHESRAEAATGARQTQTRKHTTLVRLPGVSEIQWDAVWWRGSLLLAVSRRLEHAGKRDRWCRWRPGAVPGAGQRRSHPAHDARATV